MSEFKQYIRQHLNEGGISRVLQHIKLKHPIAIISASRKHNTLKQNLAAYRNLKRDVKQYLARFTVDDDQRLPDDEGWSGGYYRVIGGYVEVDEDGKEHPVTEKSIMIVSGPKLDSNELRQFAIELGRKYNQFAIMFIDTDGIARYIPTQGTNTQQTILGKLSVDVISKFYTRLNNHHFVFKSIDECVD